MDFEKIIRERQATREFSSKKVEDEIITKILEAGRMAPTALNLQPFKIYVVKSEEGIKKMDLATTCRYGAPVVLLVCGDTNKAYKKGEHSTYEMDASIVTTHMMLEATNLGVDNIWVELFDAQVLKKEFELPENIIPVCLLPLGYKADTCPTSRNHGVRKELTELIEYK